MEKARNRTFCRGRGGTEGQYGQHHYRAGRAYAELIEWLHGKGLTARNPLHTLRKEFGSIVCQRAGVYVASRLLRHANITMTAAVYTDDRGRVTSGLGSVFGR